MSDFQILLDQPAARPAPPPRGKWAVLLQQLLDAGLAPGVVKTVKVPGGDTARALACAGLRRVGAETGGGAGAGVAPTKTLFWHIDAWPHAKEADCIQVELIEGARPGRKEVNRGEG